MKKKLKNELANIDVNPRQKITLTQQMEIKGGGDGVKVKVPA
jgi:hypothetical protein